MELQPKLIDVHVPGDAQGAVLVLHGGAARRGDMRVSPTQLSVLRMIPIAKRIARAGRDRLAVYRLLNSRRGWDAHHTPVDDARWALRQLDGLPVCLVGHSLGGRAAILAAPQVHSAVALNPWVYPDDGRRSDSEVLIVHGDQDRVARPERALAVARRIGARVEIVEGGKHAMLARHEAFSGAAADFAVQTLLG